MKSLLFFILLLAGGVVGYFYWQSSKYPVSVEAPKTEDVRKGSIEEKITGSGKLELKGGLYFVVSEKEGKIEKVTPGLVIGKFVKKGDVLITLDASIAQNRVSEAEAAVATAEADVKRADANKKEKLAQINATEKDLAFQRAKLQRAEQNKENFGAGLLNEARKEFEKAEAAAEAIYALRDVAEANITLAKANQIRAEAGLTLARRGLEQTIIKSPCDGVILDINKFVKDSQLVNAGPVNGGSLFTIAPSQNASLHEWEVKAQISEQDIGKLQQKLNSETKPIVRFNVEAYSLERIKYSGRVVDIAALPSMAVRSGLLDPVSLAALAGGGGSSGPANYTVTIAVDPIPEAISKTHPLKMGFVASDLQIIIENFNEIITVPSAALSFTPETLSDAQQKELRKNEEEGWSAVWFYANGNYSAKYIKAGASELGRTHVKEVLQGKPDDLLGKAAVIEAPKKQDTGGLFGNTKFRMPG